MKKKIKSIITKAVSCQKVTIVFTVVLLTTVTVAAVAHAGSLTPSASPTAQSYTFSNIWSRLITNTSATAGDHSLNATTTPGATFPTLTQIYNAIPTIYASDFLASSTYFGVTGTVAVKTGDTAVASSSAQGTSLVFTIPTGYYSGASSVTVSTTSANFTAANTANGTNLFGTTGSYSGYPGTGWTANESGSGSVALNETNCGATANWAWFEDGNGDGDTTDAEDGICVRTTTVTSDSWNGAEQMSSAYLGDTTATGGEGTNNTISVDATPWTVNAYKNEIIKIISGPGATSWGLIKSNTNNTITIYGGWLAPDYTTSSTSASIGNTSHFQVYNDNMYDNSFIGDYSCTGNFTTGGTVTAGSYPTSGTIALAVADCYDGKRDLLPDETDRAVISGTATAADATTITDTGLALQTNLLIGQKVLITSGTGLNAYGFVESNTTNVITISAWTGTQPVVGDQFKVIYILPRASYITGSSAGNGSKIRGTTAGDDPYANFGPLTTEALNNWKGTRLPTSMDFFGFCGATAGDSDSTAGSSAYSSSGASATTTIGNYGSNVGRGKNAAPNDEYMDLSNSGSWEWLSEPYYYSIARLAGFNACSYFFSGNVHSSYRFRAVFRP